MPQGYKDKKAEFSTQSDCKGHQRSNLHWHYIKNFMLLWCGKSHSCIKKCTQSPFSSYAALLKQITTTCGVGAGDQVGWRTMLVYTMVQTEQRSTTLS